LYICIRAVLLKSTVVQLQFFFKNQSHKPGKANKNKLIFRYLKYLADIQLVKKITTDFLSPPKRV